MLHNGDVIDGMYQIIREIGKGGTGVIYLGYHLRLRKQIVIKRIKENYTGDLTLEEVARIFDYSPNYLSRMFRKYAGITFKSYVQSIRLDYALKDLDGGRYSITEVALRNGFSGSKALARAFQKKYGMLPSEYKENKKIRNGH